MSDLHPMQNLSICRPILVFLPIMAELFLPIVLHRGPVGMTSVTAKEGRAPEQLLAPVAGDPGPDVDSDVGDARTAPRTPLRLLIVEDEILTAEYMQYLLVELGYEVCGHAINAAAAVRLAESCRPDLVLMDVNLGRGGDGVVAARQILERFAIRSLFVTAYGDRVTLGRVLSADPAGVILKPFDKQRLASAIEAASRGFGPTDG